MKSPPTSILLLELEDLKASMNTVQAELVMCVARLKVQTEEVCEVLTRLETVLTIARADKTITSW